MFNAHWSVLVRWLRKLDVKTDHATQFAAAVRVLRPMSVGVALTREQQRSQVPPHLNPREDDDAQSGNRRGAEGREREGNKHVLVGYRPGRPQREHVSIVELEPRSLPRSERLSCIRARTSGVTRVRPRARSRRP
jgi:hypothetical protein